MFYVYVDWTCESPSRPFYVGKGKHYRVMNLDRNKIHTRIKNELGIKRVVVLSTRDETFAFEHEQRLIHELNTYVFGENHWGANLTVGGDGSSGFRQSIEHVQKRVDKKRGQTHSDETKQTIREKLKGKNFHRKPEIACLGHEREKRNLPEPTNTSVISRLQPLVVRGPIMKKEELVKG